MHYQERSPCGPLQPFVKCLWRLRGAKSEIDAQPIVPDGGAELVVHLGDPFVEHDGASVRVQPRALLAATFTRSIVVVAGGEVDVVGVRFRPGAVYPFLDVPAVETVDRALPAIDVLASDVERTVRRLEPGESEALFGAIERTLAARLRRAPIDPGFDRLVGALLLGDAAVPIASLAFRAGTSIRQLERRFAQRVGISPKVLQRVVRFHRAASRVLAGELPLADIAVEAGFFDQAHMNREFRLLADTTPARYGEHAGTLDRLFAESQRSPRSP